MFYHFFEEKVMKKFFLCIALCSLFLIVSCGGGSKNDEQPDSDESVDDIDSESDSDSTDSESDDDVTDSGDSSADSGDSSADSGDSSADSGDSSADSGDSSADSGDSSADSGDSGDSGSNPGQAEIEKACKNKSTLNDVKMDCSVKECQEFVFCDFGGASGEGTVAACRDGKDNDGDGYADCKDPECQEYRFCKLGEVSSEEAACFKLIDEKGGTEACKSDKCKNQEVCKDTKSICSLAKDPYKYDSRDDCECGYAKSKYLEETLDPETSSTDDFCGSIIDNNNIEDYIAETGAAELPDVTVLKTDIDLGTQKDWIRLNNSLTFSGLFDGNNKKIRGNLSCGSTYRNCGLFLKTENATVANLNIGITVRGNVLAGAVTPNSENSIFKNIVSTSKVYANNKSSSEYSAIAGGIVGKSNNDEFSGISVYGTVSAETALTKSKAIAGGIVGFGLKSQIKNTKFSSAVTSRLNSGSVTDYVINCAGGIAGFLEDNALIENAEVNANVEASSSTTKTGSSAGGILGCTTNIYAEENGSSGNYVLSKDNTITEISSIGKITIRNVKSSGTVYVLNTTDADVSVYNFAGGIIGYTMRSGPSASSEVTGAISDSDIFCENFKIKSAYCNAGGIIGKDFYTSLRNVSFNGFIGTIEGSTNYTGGITGYGTQTKIANASASGEISMNSSLTTGITFYVGGITGYVYGTRSTVVNTYNNMVIRCEMENCTSVKEGTLAGYASDTKFFENYWNPKTLLDKDESLVRRVYSMSSSALIDASNLRYDDSKDHIIETIDEDHAPALFDRLRYNIGVIEVGGTASPNLPYAKDYRTWTTYTDANGVKWPIIDLKSKIRLEGGLDVD